VHAECASLHLNIFLVIGGGGNFIKVAIRDCLWEEDQTQLI
jgi:hypothetical protein